MPAACAVRDAVDFDGLAVVKLLFALAAFCFIGLVGPRNRRITGLLLTFPILNGIALLTDAQPYRVAETISLMVMLNSALFFIAIRGVDWLPPYASRLPELLSVLYRLLIWTIIWFLGARYLTQARDAFPSSLTLFFIQCGVAAAAIGWLWKPPPAARPAVASPRPLEAYASWGARIALFLLVFCVLLYTARHATDPRWVGMASSLPLPGLFALAYLAAKSRKEDVRPIADTVLLGPLLVIPFNFLFAAWMTVFPGRTAIGVLSLALAWGAGLGLLFWLMPKVERYLDAR
jgi:hypothetical protein